MHHVFISYSRSDGAWVRELATRLERNGLDVWIDQEDIPVTVPWLAEVQDAIEESALFLCCASPEFQRSANCTAEIAVARQVSKPQFVVAVGDDLDGCVSRVTHTVREIGPVRARRTELRVLARDWDRAGRPGNRLVSPLNRRRLERGLELPPAASEAERSFLRASKSRFRRRAGVTALLVMLIAASVITTVVLRTARDSVNSANSQAAMTYSQEQDNLDQVSRDPYRGLQLAAAAGGSESASNAAVITDALAEPTPDDAFVVQGVRRFVTRPVGSEVVVATASGQQWQHSASSSAAGEAATEPPQAVMAGSATPSPAGLTARGSAASGLVNVFRRGQLLRTIDFDAGPQVLAFSPDGRFLAAAVGEQVEIADVSAAQIRIHLRGATGELLDLTWSADGTHVWALDAVRVFSWSIGGARTLVDTPSADYNSVLPAASPDAVWIVGAHTLTEIKVTTGIVLARITINDTLSSAGDAPDGSVALVSGERWVWRVPLSPTTNPKRLRPITLPGCTIGRPTFTDDRTAYVPCIGGPLVRLSVPSATITGVIDVSPSGVFGAAAVAGTDIVYVGDRVGNLYVVQGGSTVTKIQASECDMEVQHIGVSPGGRTVLPVGSGSGEGTCTKIGLREPGGNPADIDSWTWNAVIEPQELSIYGSAVAFSPHGGSFAIGYSSGTITLHPTDNVNPELVDNTADGMVRDMLTLSDGDMIAVTNAGMVQRLQLCDACISDAALSRVAATQLKLDERLGLTRQVKTSGTP